jgi:nucleoid DNA-binding protein
LDYRKNVHKRVKIYLSSVDQVHVSEFGKFRLNKNEEITYTLLCRAKQMHSRNTSSSCGFVIHNELRAYIGLPTTMKRQSSSCCFWS